MWIYSCKSQKHPRICDYNIQDHPIKAATQSHAKYLGVTIDEHVNRIVHKANTVKAFLQGNI